MYIWVMGEEEEEDREAYLSASPSEAAITKYYKCVA